MLNIKRGRMDKKHIVRLLDLPGAIILLNQTILEVYDSLDYMSKKEVDALGKIIQINLQRKYGEHAGQYAMGDKSYAELAIRLSIYMIQKDMSEEDLRQWIKDRKKGSA